MIYLTRAQTACTPERSFLHDLKYPQYVHWFPETYDRVKSGLFLPVHRLFSKVLTSSLIEETNKHPGRTAFILASGNASLAAGAYGQMNNSLHYNYRFLPLSLSNIYAGRLAQNFDNVRLVRTDSSACASSLAVLREVQWLITMDGFDRVVVLSGEDSVSNSTLDFFGETKACILDDRKATAFDAKTGGFHVGQGAVCAVFEDESIVRGQPLARLISSFNASEDCDNPIGQRTDGQGFARAVQGALNSGKIIPERVSVVKTHGTGTQSNDLAERSALSSTLPKFIATSYKPSIGHTMGASGLLETVLLLNSLKQGVVPKIANRTEEDTVFISQDTESPDSGLLLSLAAGMGNIYSAALFDWRM